MSELPSKEERTTYSVKEFVDYIIKHHKDSDILCLSAPTNDKALKLAKKVKNILVPKGVKLNSIPTNMNSKYIFFGKIMVIICSNRKVNSVCSGIAIDKFLSSDK